jgi:hypothetical protein
MMYTRILYDMSSILYQNISEQQVSLSRRNESMNEATSGVYSTDSLFFRVSHWLYEVSSLTQV